MSKTRKRNATQRRLPDALGRARAAHEQQLRRTIRHQKRVRDLNRQLTRAIRQADHSVEELHTFLGTLINHDPRRPVQPALEDV